VWPAMLVRIEDKDCIGYSELSASPTRYIDYQLANYDGRRMLGSSLDHIRIVESFPIQTGNIDRNWIFT